MDYDVKRIADNARIYHGAQSMFAQFGSALYDVVFVGVGDGLVLQGVEGSLFLVSVVLFGDLLSDCVTFTYCIHYCYNRFHSTLYYTPTQLFVLAQITTRTPTNILTNDEHQHCTARTVVHR